MAQYVDRMTQFKNAITNVTKAMTGSKCTPFIDFYVGDLKMSTYNKYWGGCREKATLLYCWWECKLMKPLQTAVWRFLKKSKNRVTI